MNYVNYSYIKMPGFKWIVWQPTFLPSDQDVGDQASENLKIMIFRLFIFYDASWHQVYFIVIFSGNF